MKKLIIKFAKNLAKDLMKEQVKNLQDPKTEEKIAEAIAKKMPDWKEYNDEKQKEILLSKKKSVRTEWPVARAGDPTDKTRERAEALKSRPTASRRKSRAWRVGVTRAKEGACACTFTCLAAYSEVVCACI